jgi:hypothetical protein
LGSAHTASSGKWMIDCMLRGGLDVVRGDVQTRLFGGAEEDVGRLVRFSDLVMIIAVSWMRARRGRERHKTTSSTKEVKK